MKADFRVGKISAIVANVELHSCLLVICLKATQLAKGMINFSSAALLLVSIEQMWPIALRLLVSATKFQASFARL